MTDQLKELQDMFQSGEDAPVNKQVSPFLELTKKANEQIHVNLHHMIVACLLLSSLLQWWMAD